MMINRNIMNEKDRYDVKKRVYNGAIDYVSKYIEKYSYPPNSAVTAENIVSNDNNYVLSNDEITSIVIVVNREFLRLIGKGFPKKI